jgi:hypothetical protein
VHVAGRQWHYVCGVTATEVDGTFRFRKMERASFYMYPEDILGPELQPASIMWKHIDGLFQNIRDVMKSSGCTRSGSMSMPWTAACMSFFRSILFW